MDHALAAGHEGWFADLRALTGDWGFALDAVAAPVELWHGTADRMVPAAHGRWLGTHLPSAVTHVEEGHGHLSIGVGSLGEKLDVLRARAGAA